MREILRFSFGPWLSASRASSNCTDPIEPLCFVLTSDGRANVTALNESMTRPQACDKSTGELALNCAVEGARTAMHKLAVRAATRAVLVRP